MRRPELPRACRCAIYAAQPQRIAQRPAAAHGFRAAMRFRSVRTFLAPAQRL